MATHSSILAWRIPWTEEPGGLQFIGSQRVRHDGNYSTNTLTLRDDCQPIVINCEKFPPTEDPEGMELQNKIDSLYGLCLQFVSRDILPFGSYIQDLYQ